MANNPPVTTTAPGPLDPKALLLTKAIGMQEGGGQVNYNARGQSGEMGAYQWTQPTWQAQAKQVLGDANAPMTPTNQNQVAYSVVKGYLDQGYTPAQAASMWNSGKKNAYQGAGNVGTNSSGVAYDTGAYVSGVQKYAEQLYNSQPQPTVGIPTANAGDGNDTSSQSPSVSGFIGNAFNSAGQLVSGLANVAMHPVKTAEALFGTVAGAGEKAFGVNNADTQMFDNTVNYFKQRYGGDSVGDVLGHIGQTAYKDPVGMAA